MSKKDIAPLNEKGLAHGYWVDYWKNGNLAFEGTFVNGREHGVFLDYTLKGLLEEKWYYIR